MSDEFIEQARDNIAYDAVTNAQTPAEKHIDRLLGVGEIPEDILKTFYQIAAPSLALMPISSRKDRQQWLVYENTTLTLYDICNPHRKIDPYRRSQIDGVLLKYLQSASEGGFLMRMLTENTTVIKTQQEAVRAPVAAGNNGTGVVGKIKNFVRGK